MTRPIVEASSGPWRGALLLGEADCRFDPVDWLTDSEAAGPPLQSPRVAVVELRRSGGGVMPWALLAASYTPDTSGVLDVRVAHSGELTMSPAHDCDGLLGRSLATGLPKEFAAATLDGLIRFGPAGNRSGLLVVDGGAYDEADSSEYAFEHASALLKWALLEIDEDPKSEVLERFLGTLR